MRKIIARIRPMANAAKRIKYQSKKFPIFSFSRQSRDPAVAEQFPIKFQNPILKLLLKTLNNQMHIIAKNIAMRIETTVPPISKEKR